MIPFRHLGHAKLPPEKKSSQDATNFAYSSTDEDLRANDLNDKAPRTNDEGMTNSDFGIRH